MTLKIGPFPAMVRIAGFVPASASPRHSRDGRAHRVDAAVASGRIATALSRQCHSSDPEQSSG
jgi:hypothetical protein